MRRGGTRLGRRTSRWGWCSRSCRGTSRSGRRCGPLSRPSPPATACCSSTPPTSPAGRSRCSACSRRPGCPPHLVTSSWSRSPDVPDGRRRLIADDRIAAVTLTGSNRAGEMVGAAAGRAAKTSVLELGGSDAFVVLADADVEAAAAAAVRARFHNAGQSCVCAKRFIVEQSVADRFTELLRRPASRALVVGDPDRRQPPKSVRWPEPTCATTLQRQVDASVGPGATLAQVVTAVRAGVASTQPTVLPAPGRACRSSTRRPSGRSPRWRWRDDEDHASTSPNAHGIRPRLERVDAGSSRAGRGGCPADHVGRGLRQRDGGVRPAASLRRHEAQRLRARTRR